MHRPFAIAVLTLSLLCGGCFNKQYKEEKEVWNPKQWKQAVRENELRLMTEDERSELNPFAAVDVARSAAWDQLRRVYFFITGNTPFNAARHMVDREASPDQRREAVVWLSKRDYGRQLPYTKYYTHLAQTASEPTLRAMAIRALNRSREESATAVYLKAIEDQSPLVRLEAAKALANVPEPLAVEALIKRVENTEEDTDVRVAAADALRNHRAARSVQALIRVLRDRNFAVSWQARKSLKLMTGEDYRYDQAAWLTYLADAQNLFG